MTGRLQHHCILQHEDACFSGIHHKIILHSRYARRLLPTADADGCQCSFGNRFERSDRVSVRINGVFGTRVVLIGVIVNRVTATHRGEAVINPAGLQKRVVFGIVRCRLRRVETTVIGQVEVIETLGFIHKRRSEIIPHRGISLADRTDLDVIDAFGQRGGIVLLFDSRDRNRLAVSHPVHHQIEGLRRRTPLHGEGLACVLGLYIRGCAAVIP